VAASRKMLKKSFKSVRLKPGFGQWSLTLLLRHMDAGWLVPALPVELWVSNMRFPSGCGMHHARV
jgi:hypothetical protein